MKHVMIPYPMWDPPTEPLPFPAAEPLPTPEYGAHCKRCNEYNDYVEKSDDYICYGCRT